ncbi:MAG TPA: lysylphosphatidylglycerol synthase transmembrane domain-containing protein [Xanthobacteraceae bacterium]|nr:lysylphosphatidylglycerol synthase transmembrane domain-containing protein [Xanthobacteraceae bacterium]
MRKNGHLLLFILVKAAITVSLIAVIVTKIDFSILLRPLSDTGTLFLALGVLLLMANVVLVAVRWWLLLRRLNVETMPLGYVVAGTYASVFVGQATPGPIGSDAVRGWLCYSRGVKLPVIVMSLVTDRLLALLGVVMIAGSAWIWQFDAADRSLGRQLVILGAFIATVTAVALGLLPAFASSLARRWPQWHKVHEFLAMFRFVALSRAVAVGMALSCGVHLLTINAVILFARGFDMDLASSAYLVVPIAILASYVPISIGGWGVREASLSYGLVLFGTAPEDAALIGLMLGVGLLLASLPGGVVALLLRWRIRPATRDADASNPNLARVTHEIEGDTGGKA